MQLILVICSSNVLYKVTINTELANTESLLLEEMYG